jgi:transcriptional regulator
MASERTDLLAGTLEMLVLRTLSVQAMHGYAIAQHIANLSDGVLQAEQGSLYPALERLLTKGLVTAKWGESPTGRRARYYTITREGRKLLKEKTASYDRVALAIARVMKGA